MGGSSSKSTFFGNKKKKSSLNRTLKQLKMALPQRKSNKKKTNFLQKFSLDKQKKEKNSLRKNSKDKKKAPTSLKGFFLGNTWKDSGKNASERKKTKDKEGLGSIRDKIKKKLSPESRKEAEAVPVAVKEDENKSSWQKLKEMMRSSRPTKTKAN